MDNHVWNILSWNIRGINAPSKWEAIRNKIEESSCSIICLQETKREHFDISFIRNFAPRQFDNFDFIPSIGASGAGGASNSLVQLHFHGNNNSKETICNHCLFHLYAQR